jgi:hypothetical protein
MKYKNAGFNIKDGIFNVRNGTSNNKTAISIVRDGRLENKSTELINTCGPVLIHVANL